jgi:membrane fusion protein, multidrug efflux system
MNFKRAGMFLLVIAVLFIAAAGGTLQAEANAAVPGKCPKKVAVVLETVKKAVFLEYQFSGQGQAEIIAVKSPVSGLLSEIKVSEGSLVDAGQDLVVLNAGLSEEIKKLTAETVKTKKILTARQNWKVKNEKAVQTAAKDYQKALNQLNEKKALANQIVKAPLAGIVHLLMAVGSETAAEATLLEISNPKQMLFRISLTDADKGLLTVGDKFTGTTDGFSGEVEAEVIAVSESRATFKVNNNENQVKEGVTFTFKKLQAEHADAIVIPTSAIQHDSLGDFVYVAEKKKAKKLYVTLGKSRAGKTMVVKGLAADTPLIISGIECLAAGKRIRIVNQEELAKEKVETQAKEKAEVLANKEAVAIAKEKAEAQAKEKAEVLANKEAVTIAKEKAKTLAELKEKEVTPTAAKEEKIAPTDKSRFRVGLLFGRFSVNDKNLRAFYLDWFKNIPGIELSVHTLYNVDVWASYKIFTNDQTTTYFAYPTTFKLVPLSVGLRYRFPKWHFIEPFVGAGLNFYSYKETIGGESDLEDTKGSALGFHFQGGAYFDINPSFMKKFSQKSNIFLLGEIFLKYNIVKKTLVEPLPDGTDTFDLGGFEMGIGLGVKF